MPPQAEVDSNEDLDEIVGYAYRYRHSSVRLRGS